MNGIHDMGGMHGFGRIERERNEPVFHERWEARMFGIAQAMTSPPGATIDRRRFLRESMPPAAYLSQSYYEHWYFARAAGMLEAGMATLEELGSGRAAPGSARRDDALRAADIVGANATRGIFEREAKEPPRWYKAAPYRSRAVRDPRGVLKEFGVELGDDVEVRVWDSTAEVRYMVLPERPPRTEGMSEPELARLVTRDAMIGTAMIAAPGR